MGHWLAATSKHLAVAALLGEVRCCAGLPGEDPLSQQLQDLGSTASTTGKAAAGGAVVDDLYCMMS